MGTEEKEIFVFRYGPENDLVPRFHEYKIPLTPRMTVLDGLRMIKDDIDGTLAMRYSCRSAICGSCAMRINGNSQLACNTMIESELEKHGKLVIEPLANMNIIKDLVVDMGSFWNHIESQRPWLMPGDQNIEPMHEYPMTQKQVDKFENTPNCILCGACHAVCPAVEVDEDFPGPAALSMLYRFVIDARDDSDRTRLESTTDMGLWGCVRCYLCVDACPKDVRPGEMITNLRELASKEVKIKEPGGRHAQAFHDNIKKYGNLNELALAKDSVGKVGMLKQTLNSNLGIRMLKKGKIPPISQKPIPKIDQVKKIYEDFEENESDDE